MKKKIAVVTGGAGRIGSLFSEILLKQQYKVYILSSNSSNFAKKYSKKNKRISWIKFDLRNPKVEEIKFLFKGICIDCLVNCAAYSDRGENISYDKDNFYDEIKGIFGSSVLLSESLLPNLRKKGGIIINVGSIWGLVSPDFRTYLNLNNAPTAAVSIGKAGLMQYTKFLASREAKHKIRVNNLVPGFFPRPGKITRGDYIEEIKKRTMLNKIGKLRYLIPAIEFLLSENNIYYTSQNLIVDGGYTSW
jgi:NAD(P)-dependent dehydrogenase (short-subunit alcohol dehydrogenase family)